MRLRSVLATGSLAAALLLAPGMASAKMEKRCPMNRMSMLDNSSENSKEALSLMRTIRDKSGDVATQADKLVITQPLAVDSWDYQVDKLNIIKSDINAMGKRLSRLQGIRLTLPVWQQAAVDQAARKLQLMAVHTDDAFAYLNARHTGLWRPEFQKYESVLQTEAHELHRLMGDYVGYSRAAARQHSLAAGLDLNAAS